MRKKIIYIMVLTFIVASSLVGCNSKLNHSELLSKYIEINKDYTEEKLTKNRIQEIIGLDTSIYEEGDENKFNTYTYSINDEELIILTDNKTDELVFIKYNKLNEIDLVNSLREGTDMGGYKPGFTSKFEINTFDNQEDLLNIYLKNK